MTKVTVQRAIEIVKSQTYDDSQFYQFVDVEGHRLPAKRFYSALFDVPYQDINTHKAERELRKVGYEIISTRSGESLMSIWKVSHGKSDISWEQSEWLDKNHLLCVHEDTKKSQGIKFISEIKVGDVISLSRGSDVKAIVRVSGELENIENAPFDEGWVFRRYEAIKELSTLKRYESLKRGWAPNYNSTVHQVPITQYGEFESEVLTPFFGMQITELEGVNTEFNDMNLISKTVSEDLVTTDVSLNQILYGPPGTGKTYHTIEDSVKAAEPEFIWETRDQVKAEYNRLVDEKRIRFVTFHQSYGYEEFVEGLSVRSVDGEAVYYERDGIFKQIVDDAMKHHMSKTTASSDVFDSCWLQFLEQLASDEEDGVVIETKRTSFTITAIENGTIRFEKDKGASVHTLNVKTLKAIFDGERVINGGLNPYYSALINHLRSIAEKLPDTKIERKNFVLVIDEINRGNISKIFGELITLLEPSKRYGKDEVLALTLPYSGETFKVPDNLYIIGTMNTADRSLAMMDTALRRRFDFKEMMPNASVLAGCEVNGINLEALLSTLNERIEVLYDREHTLGHAFFIPVKDCIDKGDEEDGFNELVSVFQNKILPLLQEYFFDDWGKIRLVLGDNQRGSTHQLIEEQTLNGTTLSQLFGSEHNLDPYGEGIKQYKLKAFDDDVWQDPNVYILMYDNAIKGKNNEPASEEINQQAQA
jgi:5-methylcytosine-specific restriction enzyme B